MPSVQKFFQEVNHEQALAIIEEMTDKTERHGPATSVYTGSHPQHGAIHVVLPALGDVLLLPADLHAKPLVVQSL